MNRLFGPLIVGIMLPTLMAQAEVPLKQMSTFHLPVLTPPSINLSQNLPQLNKEPDVKSFPKNSKRHITYDWSTVDLNTQTKLDELSLSRKYSGFLSDLSPEYTIDRNWLGLTQILEDKKKRAIRLIFCMNKRKKNVQPAQRTRIHVLWPGSRKRMRDQILVEKEYPVDISVANYRDGYAPREWNIALPSKKPKEVTVSLLWSF
jgi:hypothetical protein